LKKPTESVDWEDIHFERQMTNNTKDNIDARTLFVLEKLREEYEIARRQGFPSRKRDRYSQYSRSHDAEIPEKRWRAWANERGIDYVQLEAVLKILENEGLLEEYDFIPDYM
jgi:hypothetical protein